MATIKVPSEVTRGEIEAAFPWVCYLPGGASGEFAAAIDIYRAAAEVYSGQREPSLFDLTDYVRAFGSPWEQGA